MNLAKKSSAYSTQAFALARQRFSTSISGGNAAGAGQLIDELLAGQRSLVELYLEVIAPALVSVGDSWCRGEIGVGDEHLATQIVIQQMDRLRSLFVPIEPRSAYRVLVACVEGEQHFVGARMLADLCLSKGWAVDFLGANTPTSAIIEIAKRHETHLVALSATMPKGMTHVRRLVKELTAMSPKPNLVLGGQIFAATAAPVSLQQGCVIAREAAEGIEIIGKLLRAERPKAMLKEYLLTLGHRVREFRTKEGWTQEELAEAARVTRVCIVAVEGGKQNVSMDILIRIANALRVAPEILLASKSDLPTISRRDA